MKISTLSSASSLDMPTHTSLTRNFLSGRATKRERRRSVAKRLRLPDPHLLRRNLMENLTGAGSSQTEVVVPAVIPLIPNVLSLELRVNTP